jgi:NodT family efflux transporter outer membrane factor (OMF) lipoprotein
MRSLPLLALLLSGCAVGPDFHRPTPVAAASYAPTKLVAHDDAQAFVQGLDIPGQWWQVFHAPKLDILVTRALAANPSLQAAQSALVQARENLYAQEGSFFPNLSATFEPTRNKTATRSVSFAAAQPTPYYTLITAQLAISYSPDLWGGTRRQVENLVAVAQQQRFQLEATTLTLTSNLVTAAINEAALRGQIAATQDIITAETALLAVLQKQYALGQIAQVDVLSQQAALAQAQGTLPPLQKQLDQQRDALATLVGAPPDQLLPQTFTLDDIALPTQLPVSLPASLVEQRPDMRQAEENLHAACALVGVAIANRLPSLTLTAEGGSQSNFFRDLFASGNGFWTLAATLTQPVFDGGTLLHRARAAWAAFDQAKAQYRSTTLSAYQNVADTLAALQTDADALASAKAGEDAAQASLKIIRLQVSLGQVAYLSILNAQQTALQSELTLIQAKANRLTDTAALFQALGGGWWNRHDVTVTDLRGNDAAAIVGIR